MADLKDTILIKSSSGQFKKVDLELNDEQNFVDKNIIDKGLNKNKFESQNEDLKRQIIEDLKKPELPDLKPEIVKAPKEENKLPEVKPVSSSAVKPAFYFHREDEEEVAKFRDEKREAKRSDYSLVIQNLVDKIIKESNLFLDGIRLERLKKVLDSRLKEVRKLWEAKAVLVREISSGGVGLNEEEAHKILKITEDRKLKILDILSEENIEQIKRQQKSKKIVPQASAEEIKLKEVKPEAKVEMVEPKKIPGEVKRTSSEIIPPAPPVVSSVPAPSPSLVENLPRVMSVADELASYNLERFRALGPNVGAVLAQIKEKISLLQDESYEKMVEGIRGWRSSPIYKSYMDVGRESLEQQKSISQLIQEKEQKNLPTLSLEEFNAIADFNEDLGY